jgi:hypothetical protein
MNLQRISEFAENQEGKPSLLVKWPRRPPSLHPEVFTQVDSANGIILDDLVWLAFCQNTAFANDVGMITNTQGFPHIMVCDEDTNLAVS